MHKLTNHSYKVIIFAKGLKRPKNIMIRRLLNFPSIKFVLSYFPIHSCPIILTERGYATDSDLDESGLSHIG